MEIAIHTNQWVTAFISENWMLLGLALAVLKVIAKATPWAGDDQIVQIFTGFFGRVRGNTEQHPRRTP